MNGGTYPFRKMWPMGLSVLSTYLSQQHFHLYTRFRTSILIDSLLLGVQHEAQQECGAPGACQKSHPTGVHGGRKNDNTAELTALC